MAVTRYYSSLAQPTTLTASVNSSATMINVAATTGFPSGLPYTLALDAGGPAEELVDVTAVAGTTLTVTRGVDGTSAQSHGVGAVVRHSSSARDFAESRTHEAATAAVHGVTGTLVGTTDAQTLTNKTLTAPTVAGGALSGTFTGTPTFSGAVVYSGAPSFTGAPTFSGNPVFSGAPSFTGAPAFSAGAQFVRAAAADAALQAQVTGDAQQRYQVLADGTQQWGPGSAGADTNLYRASADTLATDDSLIVSRRLTASGGAELVGDPSPSTGGVILRAGAASNNAAEFRNAAGTTVATVSNSGVGTFTSLSLSADPAWTAFPPSWVSTGAAPNIGNGTLAGRYKRIGKTVHLVLLCQFGTTTTFGTGTYGWSYPAGLQPAQNTPTILTYHGAARGHAATWYAGTAAYDHGTDTFRVYSHGDGQEWSPTTPTTWAAAANNYLSFSITYETV